MQVIRYFGLVFPLLMLPGVASAQSPSSQTGAAKAGSILTRRTTAHASSNDASHGEVFSHENQVFAHTPTNVMFGAVRTAGNERRFAGKAIGSQSTGRAATVRPRGMQDNAESTQAAGSLVLGQPVTLPFALPAVSEPTLFAGDYGFQVAVPTGASRLEIDLSAAPATVQLGLFARFGQDVGLSSGGVVADYFSPGFSATERIVVTTSSTPALQAGTEYIAFGLLTTGTAVSGSLTVTAFAAATGGQTGSQLISGVPSGFSLPAVPSPTLFNGEYGYYVTVPAGARSLAIVLSTAVSGAGINLYTRFGQDVSIAGGSVVADYTADGPTGSQRILITPASSPALCAGTYYVALGFYDTGSSVSGSITATVDSGAADPPPVNFTFSFPAVSEPTLFAGDYGAQIVVPPGATSLTIKINTATPNADVDLYVRFGQDVGLSAGSPLADYSSEGPTGSESITITTSSPFPLQAGTYYIAYGVFTPGVAIDGSGTAAIATAGTVTPGPATSVQTCNISLPQVSEPTLFAGDYGCQFVIPAGATRVQIQMSISTPNVDVDLYARTGSDIALSNGYVVADFSSSGLTGDLPIAITPLSSVPLQAGTYYVGFGVFTPGAAIDGTVTATVTR